MGEAVAVSASWKIVVMCSVVVCRVPMCEMPMQGPRLCPGVPWPHQTMLMLNSSGEAVQRCVWGMVQVHSSQKRETHNNPSCLLYASFSWRVTPSKVQLAELPRLRLFLLDEEPSTDSNISRIISGTQLLVNLPNHRRRPQGI